MKKRRYEEGGRVDDDNSDDQEVDRKTYASGVRMSKDYLKTPKKAAAKSSESRSEEAKESSTRSMKQEDPTETEDTRGTMQRKGKMGFRREMPSDEKKEEFSKRFMKTAAATALGGGAGAVARGAAAAHKAANVARAERYAREEAAARYAAQTAKEAERMNRLGSGRVGEAITETRSAMKRGGSVRSSASRRADGIAARGKTKGRLI